MTFVKKYRKLKENVIKKSKDLTKFWKNFLKSSEESAKSKFKEKI